MSKNLEETFTGHANSANNTQIPWVPLPVGKSIPKSGDSTNTIKVQNEPTKSSNIQKAMFKFKFKKGDYDDVCSLLNVINVLDYMHDEDSVSILEPYLDQTVWENYQEKHDITNQPGFELSVVMQLLQRECHYREKSIILKMLGLY